MSKWISIKVNVSWLNDLTPKEKVKRLFLILLGLCIVKFLYFGTKNLITQPKLTYDRCGEILKKYDENDVKEYHSDHNYYFDMKYDDGAYESIGVSTKTWYENREGARVCFEESKGDLKSNWIGLSMVITGLTGIVLGGGLIIWFFRFIFS